MSMIRRGLHNLVWQAHDTLLACATFSCRFLHGLHCHPLVMTDYSHGQKRAAAQLRSLYRFSSNHLLTLELVGDRESGLFVIGELQNYREMIFTIGQALRNHLVQCLYFSQVNQLRSRESFVIFPRPLQQFNSRIRTRIQDSCHPVQCSFWNSMYFPL